MVRVKSILIVVIVCAVFLLSACGKSEEGSNQPSSTQNSNSIQTVPETENKKERLMQRNFWNML